MRRRPAAGEETFGAARRPDEPGLLMTQLLPGLYAVVTDTGELALNLPRAIANLRARGEDGLAPIMAEWLENCLALAQEHRPETVTAGQRQATVGAVVIAYALTMALAELPDDALELSVARVTNLCGLDWSGNRAAAETLQRLIAKEATR